MADDDGRALPPQQVTKSCTAESETVSANEGEVPYRTLLKLKT